MKIEISNGDLVDKWAILTIKLERIESEEAKANVKQERDLLTECVQKLEVTEEQVSDLIEVNLALWDVEDRLRAMESNQMFDQDFIEAARSVYLLNDNRARIKKDINESTDSLLVEEKSYISYVQETKE